MRRPAPARASARVSAPAQRVDPTGAPRAYDACHLLRGLHNGALRATAQIALGTGHTALDGGESYIPV